MMGRSNNSPARRVRRAYSQSELTEILTLPETEFGDMFGMRTTEVEQRSYFRWDAGKKALADTPNDYYHYRDNGSSVLAVAHLDTVVKPKGRIPAFYKTRNGPAVISGALDDRLGAYVILRLLPKLGVTCDWLLTVGEESGQSTARFFQTPKAYDHIIEFDRGGTDVVMYQYDDHDTRDTVRECGADVGEGSFSDICYLEQLNVKAFNWGVGYQGNYHSEHGYAILGDTFDMVGKYLRFHKLNAGIAMPHEAYSPECEYRLDCDQCLALDSVDADTLICEYCLSCLECGNVDCKCRPSGGTGDDAMSYQQWLAKNWPEGKI